MSDKFYLGNAVADLDTGEAEAVTHVILNVDSDTYYEAGNDTGKTLEVTCPWGSQAMADSILETIGAVSYIPFEGEDALLDPAAEIGDWVTVGGVYSVLARADISLDRQFSADIAAPGGDEIDDEYPYESHESRETNRKLAKTVSLISKTAEGIRLEIADSVDGLSSSIDLQLDSISAEIVGVENTVSSLSLDLNSITSRVQDAEGNIGQLQLTATELSSEISGKIDGDYAQTLIDQALDSITLSVSSSNGSTTFTLKDGTTTLSTTTLSLSVNAAYISGTLTIGQLPSSVATTSDIPTKTSQLTNDSGYQTASGVTTIVAGTVTTDYVNALGITAGSVSASNITSGTIAASLLKLNGLLALLYSGSTYGYVGASSAGDTPGAVLADSTLTNFVTATNTGVRMSYGGRKYEIYVASNGCVSTSAMVTESDRRYKHSISYDMAKYAPLFDKLKPCFYLLYREGQNARYRIGFVAQDILDAAQEIGLTEDDLALLGRDEDGYYTVGYTEITPLNTWKIQQLDRRMTELERRLAQ